MPEWWDRWRAPQRLVACAPVRSVLVLCTANRVRSPFAEQVLRARLGHEVPVRSRGVLPGGLPCPPEAILVAEALGVTLTGHVAQQLTPAELLAASVVLVMEQEMALRLGSRYPSLRARLLPLGWFDPEPGWGTDIDDPFQRSREDYQEAYERLHRSTCAVAAQLHELIIR